MLSKKKYTTQSSMFFGLEDMLNQKHPMYILANKVDWQMFEDSSSPLYCLDSGGLAPPS
jgi:IS5 family transposase